MRRRKRERERVRALLDALNALADGLRGGASLRQALTRAAAMPNSPFALIADALAEGHPLAATLHAAAARSDGDAEVASAFCVLAVFAQAGGDPLPACRAVADRVARRAVARDEARALTTQARLGARAILLLTPGFLVLVAASDPRGAVQWFAAPATRVAIVAGLLLQAAGALWVRAIVNGVSLSDGVFARVPVLRAIRALLAGRLRSSLDADVAACAELMAFAIDAGLSLSAALSAVVPHVTGPFGTALRDATRDVGVRPHQAIAAAVADLDGDAAQRFARAIATTAELGVPVAEALRALAADLDGRTSLRLAEDVRVASIRVLIPLGVFVLPAFVLACLVPLFVGGLQGIAG